MMSQLKMKMNCRFLMTNKDSFFKQEVASVSEGFIIYKAVYGSISSNFIQTKIHAKTKMKYCGRKNFTGNREVFL